MAAILFRPQCVNPGLCIWPLKCEISQNIVSHFEKWRMIADNVFEIALVHGTLKKSQHCGCPWSSPLVFKTCNNGWCEAWSNLWISVTMAIDPFQPNSVPILSYTQNIVHWPVHVHSLLTHGFDQDDMLASHCHYSYIDCHSLSHFCWQKEELCLRFQSDFLRWHEVRLHATTATATRVFLHATDDLPVWPVNRFVTT